MPRTMRTLARRLTLDKNLHFLDRLRETQYNRSQGDPFEKVVVALN